MLGYQVIVMQGAAQPSIKCRLHNSAGVLPTTYSDVASFHRHERLGRHTPCCLAGGTAAAELGNRSNLCRAVAALWGNPVQFYGLLGSARASVFLRLSKLTWTFVNLILYFNNRKKLCRSYTEDLHLIAILYSAIDCTIFPFGEAKQGWYHWHT